MAATCRASVPQQPRLVKANGFAATSVDEVKAASSSSKGAFFHHFASKQELAVHLVQRYVEADIAELEEALDAVAAVEEPGERLVAFLRWFEDRGDEVMAATSNCLYVAVLTERQLVDDGTTGDVNRAVVAWRTAIADLLRAALPDTTLDLDAVADHVFVTFEGAFILCRSTGEPEHMRRQLRTLREMVAALVS
jgi:TetR/AcrR family transcriptional repressor of nem operon